MNDRVRRNLARLAASLAFVGFCVLYLRRVRVDWPFTIDDAFITLRYARHLAQGLGPVWNPGEPPVEGYTSALWMVLLASADMLGFDGVRAAKVLGVVFGLVAIGTAAGLAARLAQPHRPSIRAASAAFACAASAAYWPFALHAVSAMETTLAAASLTGFFACLVRFEDGPTRGAARALACFSVVSALARPEAALVCGASLATLLVRAGPRDRRTLAEEIALFAILPGASYFVARYACFGLLFPLPFYVKATGHARFAGLDEVGRFFSTFSLERPDLGLLLAIAIVVHRARLSAVLAGVAALALFFVFPAHIQGYLWRYLAPVVPALAAIAGVGFGTSLELLLSKTRIESRRVVCALATVAIVGFALVPFPGGEAFETRKWVTYGRGLEHAHVRLGRSLAALTAVTERPVIALLDVGAISYYSEWRTIDTLGLNDVHVAMSKHADVDYVFAQRPELVVVVSSAHDRYAPLFDWEIPIYRRALAEGFVRARAYRFLDHYHLVVLVRPDSRLRNDLVPE